MREGKGGNNKLRAFVKIKTAVLDKQRESRSRRTNEQRLEKHNLINLIM